MTFQRQTPVGHPVANTSPVRLKLTLRTSQGERSEKESPHLNRLSSRPVAMSQSLAKLSSLPVATINPSGENAMLQTRRIGPLNRRSSWPDIISQTRALERCPSVKTPVANSLAVGLNATQSLNPVFNLDWRRNRWSRSESSQLTANRCNAEKPSRSCSGGLHSRVFKR